MALTCLLTVFLLGENRQFNEKLIVSYSTQKQVAKDDLLALKVYFGNNVQTQKLKEKYHLQFKLERLDDYNVLVIYPINSLNLRNDLLLRLGPLFPNMFAVKMSADQEKKMLTNTITQTTSPTVQGKVQVLKPQREENDLELQWIVLLLVSAVGLILSIRNRKKLATLKQGQEDMQNNQEKIETEIDMMGAHNA